MALPWMLSSVREIIFVAHEPLFWRKDREQLENRILRRRNQLWKSSYPTSNKWRNSSALINNAGFLSRKWGLTISEPSPFIVFRNRSYLVSVISRSDLLVTSVLIRVSISPSHFVVWVVIFRPYKYLLVCTTNSPVNLRALNCSLCFSDAKVQDLLKFPRNLAPRKRVWVIFENMIVV
jgi:hypothetical protein